MGGVARSPIVTESQNLNPVRPCGHTLPRPHLGDKSSCSSGTWESRGLSS